MSRRTAHPDQSDPASRLRIARACMLGIRECATDLGGFADRGLAAIDQARVLVGDLPDAAAKASRPRGRKPPARRRRRATP